MLNWVHCDATEWLGVIVSMMERVNVFVPKHTHEQNVIISAEIIIQEHAGIESNKVHVPNQH